MFFICGFHGENSSPRELTATVNTTLLFPPNPRSPITIPSKRPTLFDLYPTFSNPRNSHKSLSLSQSLQFSDDKNNLIKYQDSTSKYDSKFNIQNPQKRNLNHEKETPPNSSISRGLVHDLGSESYWGNRFSFGIRGTWILVQLGWHFK